MPDETQSGFTVRFSSASVAQWLTLLGIVGIGGAWGVESNTQTHTYEQLTQAMQRTDEKIGKLERTLVDELDRRRAAETQAAAAAAERKATLTLIEARVLTLETCVAGGKCPHKRR